MTNRNSVLRKHATVFCVVALGFLFTLGCAQPVDNSPAEPGNPVVEDETNGLSAEDLVLVEQQGICPVSQAPLGSMGDPIKVDVNGTPVFICCEGCRARLLGDPEKYLAVLENGVTEDESDPGIAEALAGLSPGDLILVDQQKICPVMKTPLGSMGDPIKVDVNGTPIFICCEGCRSKLLADPETYLANLDQE